MRQLTRGASASCDLEIVFGASGEGDGGESQPRALGASTSALLTTALLTTAPVERTLIETAEALPSRATSFRSGIGPDYLGNVGLWSHPNDDNMELTWR